MFACWEICCRINCLSLVEVSIPTICKILRNETNLCTIQFFTLMHWRYTIHSRLLIPLVLLYVWAVTYNGATVQFSLSTKKSQNSGLARLASRQRRERRSFEHFSDPFACSCRTFDVGVRLDVSGCALTFLCAHKLCFWRGKIRCCVRIGSEVFLGADEDDGRLGAEETDFRSPLLNDVRQAVGVIDTEAD